MKKIFIFFWLLVFSLSVSAHSDTIIHPSFGGYLLGLPFEYFPARLNLSADKISIGKQTLNMPPCLSKYFQNPNSYDLEITSSWYHESSTLPPYIKFRITQKNGDSEVVLLLNLTNLSPIDFTLATHLAVNNTGSYMVEKLTACKLDIERSIEKPNT